MTHKRRPENPDSDQSVMRCVIDREGRFVFVSPALGWMLGQTSRLLTGAQARTVIDIVTNLDTLEAPHTLSTIETGLYEVALLRKNRAPLTMRARIERVETEERGMSFVVSLDSDQPPHTQTNNASAHSSREYAVMAHEAGSSLDDDEMAFGHFLNLTHDLMAICQRDMSFRRVNPAFSRVLGFSDAALRRLSFITLVHPEDREDVTTRLQEMTLLRTVDIECRALCKDSSVRRIAWRVKSAGACLYCVGRDVTDMHGQEHARAWREQQFSEAMKMGNIGNWYWESDDGVLRDRMEWSDSIYVMFGLQKDDLLIETSAIKSLILETDVKRVMDAARRAFTEGTDYSVEFCVRRPSGSIRHIRCEGRCRIDAATGRTIALYGIMQDTTERMLHEKALRGTKDAAAEAYSSKTRFLANMSHELRTPLNAIIGFSEMMQRQLLGPIGNARYADYIGGIRQSGEHLLDLINDILDMSKIEVGKYELHPENINVGKVMRLAVHMVEGRAQEAQINLITDGVLDNLHILADRRALMQVLLNILSNAVKFTPMGGKVSVRCERELDGVSLSISDTGIGIPPDKISIVTLPFEQVDSELTRSREGTGLGLAITKELVGLHGGILSIESEVGTGTTVTVFLPEKAQKKQTA